MKTRRQVKIEQEALQPPCTTLAPIKKSPTRKHALDTITFPSPARKQKTLPTKQAPPSPPAASTASTSSATAPTQPIGMITISKKGLAPVDLYCPDREQLHVYSDKEGVYDAMLNQTNILQNNNKFYLIQVLKSDHNELYYYYNRWGRVGRKGQNRLFEFPTAQQAINLFKEKFFAKTRNQWEERGAFVKHPGKYDLLELDYGEEQKEPEIIEPATIPESCLKEKQQEIIKLIFNIEKMTQMMVQIGYDATKMPLGKLTKTHIQKAYHVLKEIAEQLDQPQTSRTRLIDLSSRFYTLIPHEFGMRPPPVMDRLLLQEKLILMQSLADIEIATTLIKTADQQVSQNPLDVRYHSLHCDMETVPPGSHVYQTILAYMTHTHAPTHLDYSLELQDVYIIQRRGEREAFNAECGNRMLLWHGSPLTNYVGILSQGLRIAPPEAPMTGYMFGKGIYFTDMVSKAANYCCATEAQDVGLVLLCDVALGECNELRESDARAGRLLKKNRKHSTKGLGGTIPEPGIIEHIDGMVVPIGTPVSSGIKDSELLYNEYIVYDPTQVCLRYMVKVRFVFKSQGT